MKDWLLVLVPVGFAIFWILFPEKVSGAVYWLMDSAVWLMNLVR